MIHVIRKSWNNQEKLEDSVDKIEISTRHLMDLVNDVLDMSKLESGHLTVHEEPFDLEDLMKEVASTDAGTAGRNWNYTPQAQGKYATYYAERGCASAAENYDESVWQRSQIQ